MFLRSHPLATSRVRSKFAQLSLVELRDALTSVPCLQRRSSSFRGFRAAELNRVAPVRLCDKPFRPCFGLQSVHWRASSSSGETSESNFASDNEIEEMQSQIPGMKQAGDEATSADAIEEEILAKLDESQSPASPESVAGPGVRLEFQAETRQILDIVANSLYTEKEVFLRELISNGSDALEKARHLQLSGVELAEPDKPLEIHIEGDPDRKALIIQDSGIGMTREELIEHLGTIARSGSRAFLRKLESEGQTASGDAATNIIGRFGVGFYSAFMVASAVRVFSKSALPGSKGHVWTSDGHGTFEIADAEGVSRGTKIVVQLKDTCTEFADKNVIQSIIKKYSNFVGYPITVNGAKVNTVEAIWLKDKSQLTELQYNEFYRFVANAFDDPTMTLHFAADSPISIRAVLFVPEMHSEKYGVGRMEPGVNLYSRKILIQHRARGLLPDWLRFIKGVVDCEDIPLNISREHLQDSALIKRINSVLTKRLLRHFLDEAKNHKERYTKFYTEFGQFLKEGLCIDRQYKDELSKLLRFESSTQPEGDLTSFDDYVSRMKPDQKFIYYQVVPTRQHAALSPYLESMNHTGFEVLFMHQLIDEFVVGHMGDYNGKRLVSIESPEVETKASEQTKEGLSAEDATKFADWLKNTLPERLEAVKVTQRVMSSPAVIVGHESSMMRNMRKMMDQGRIDKEPKYTLEINPKHHTCTKLFALSAANPTLAKTIAEQMVDNAAVGAGLVADSRTMLPRLNSLLDTLLDSVQAPPSS